jgi:hypothetical protein
MVVGTPAFCFAQSWPSLGYFGVWKHTPSIVIISDTDDARIPAVYDAIAFWNAMLANIGSAFRLGRLSHIADTTPPEDVRRESHRGLNRLLELFGPDERLHDHISTLDSDVIVALTDGPKSFTGFRGGLQKSLVVIGDYRTYAHASSNDILFAIAHELGHAIGMDHNDGEGSLMCERRCLPVSPDEPLSLTSYEKRLLLKMYPPDWRSTKTFVESR